MMYFSKEELELIRDILISIQIDGDTLGLYILSKEMLRKINHQLETME